MRLAFIASALLLAAGACGAADSPRSLPHPDLSGFWNLDVKVPRDPQLMSQVGPDTAFIDDTGPVELPRGNYGGLKLTPAALDKAKHWDPRSQLTPENACRPPSIVYALQGPFPIEIFQSDKFIVMKLEYYDLVRIIFLDGRRPEADYPHSPTGFSSGHWEGSTLVVRTDHLEPATITNNGVDHDENIQVLERFRLSDDGKHLLATQEYSDPAVMENHGVRFIAWTRQAGQHVYPYECDPGFAGNYEPPPAKH